MIIEASIGVAGRGMGLGVNVWAGVGVGVGVDVDVGVGVWVGVRVAVGGTVGRADGWTVSVGVANAWITCGAAVMAHRLPTVTSTRVMISVSPSDKRFKERCISSATSHRRELAWPSAWV